MNYILPTIKKMLGIANEDDGFDADVIVWVNAAFMELTQMGVGPPEGFTITGPSEKWSDFVSDTKLHGAIQSYVYIKTRLGFDPSGSSTVVEVMNRRADELAWRINHNIEGASTT